MKRLILAGLLATGIHSYLLGTEFGWLQKKTPPKPKPRTINLSLVYQSPRPPQPKPILKNPELKVQKALPAPPKLKMKSMATFQMPETPPKPIQKSQAKGIPYIPPIFLSKSFSEPKQTDRISENLVPKPPQIPDELAISGTDTEKETIKNGRQKAIPLLRKARPLYRKNSPPEYPRIARKRGYQGVVILDVLVDQNGKTNTVRVFKTSGYPVLDRAAVASVNDWRFEPGMNGDEPADMWIRIPIRFKLK